MPSTPMWRSSVASSITSAVLYPPAPREHGHFAFGLLNGDLDHAQMLGARERGALAGGAAGHQKINSSVDLPPDQAAHGGLIER